MTDDRTIERLSHRVRRAENRIDALSRRLSRFTRTKKKRPRRRGDKAALHRDTAVRAFIERNAEGRTVAQLRRLVRDTYGDGRTPSRSVVSAYVRRWRKVSAAPDGD